MTTRIRIEGDTEFRAKLRKAKGQLKEDIQGAAVESLDEVLDVQGIRAYPPETAGNRPPTPYWVRGQGMQTASGNLGNSEKYAMKGWSKKNYQVQAYGASATNTTSYGGYLGGDQQAAAMGRIGWRKISDVAKEKQKAIGVIFGKWIKRGLRRVGLL